MGPEGKRGTSRIPGAPPADQSSRSPSSTNKTGDHLYLATAPLSSLTCSATEADNAVATLTLFVYNAAYVWNRTYREALK